MIITNSEMTMPLIKKYCKLDKDSSMFLKNIAQKNNISARAYFKLIKLARTLADLEGSLDIKIHNLAEAVQFRIKGS